MKKAPNKKTAKPLPVQKLQVSIIVNGEKREWQILPGDLLLDVLRREGYFGVKRGCETGECGACTVLLDGKPVNSCMMFAAQANGRKITTIEGLGHNGQLDEVPQALVDHGAVQCGFCTPGVALTAEAFLRENPNPTERQAAEALSGNLCRCTGYKKPVEALLAASQHKKCESRYTEHEHDTVGHNGGSR